MANLLRNHILGMFLVLSGLVVPLDRPAVQQGSADPRDFVCAPRLQLRHPELCPRHGPGAALTDPPRT